MQDEGLDEELNKEEEAFYDALYDLATQQYAASILSPGGEVFSKALFTEFKAQHPAPAAEDVMQAWFEKRLVTEFVCTGERPKWKTEQCEWCYHEGRPVVFVGQMQVPANAQAQKTNLVFGRYFLYFCH